MKSYAIFALFPLMINLFKSTGKTSFNSIRAEKIVLIILHPSCCKKELKTVNLQLLIRMRSIPENKHPAAK